VAVAASALVVALSGCGRLGGSASTASGAGTSSPTVVASEKLFDEIADGGVLPNQAQTDAAAYLEHVTFESMIVDCMAGKGFVYNAPAAFRVPSPIARIGGGALDPVDPTVVDADGLGLNVTLAGLVANAKAGEPFVYAEQDEPSEPGHELRAWNEAERDCTPMNSTALDARVAHPAYARADAFHELVEDVIDTQPVSSAMAAYPGCMSANGWSVKSRHDLVWSVRGEFEDLLVHAERSFSANPARRAAQVDELVRSDAWRRLEQRRGDAASADASCRQAAHDRAFTALLDPLRRYQADHAAEIEELRAEWAAFEQRANRTPDPAQR
jgi:hypothetical protein